ncbi:thiol oxidoreductase [Sphingobacteriaceae bacterium]|nr:thiol oxidoreductase [Sphingobacteriaceae bacterium]
MKMIKRKYIVCIVMACLSLLACKKTGPKAAAEEELLDGPVEGLSGQEKEQFLKGDRAFNNDIFTKENGLGPIFVANSCGSCHAGDGKGHPFTSLIRFGQYDSTGNQYLDFGGPQLQNRAIPGYNPEVLPLGARSSKLLPPANTGLGYLDAVSDADILAMADPYDADGDGISGVANWVHTPSYCDYRAQSIERNGKHIGRFGRKGAAYDLLQQTANAYNQDMGINSSFEPIDTYSHSEVDPEISNAAIHSVVFYLRTLKAPIQRQPAKVESGRQVFTSLGCETCHKAQLKTGDYKIAVLANKTFYPYTDLLLHDMGPGLDDGYTEGSATTAEWRTPALWGLGLSKNSQGGNYYLMHDGRATSIESAILMHGGEGEKSKLNYQSLSVTDKNNLIQFLESL